MHVCARFFRMKLRSPQLPDDIEAIWDYFLDKLPDWLWRKYTRSDNLKKIVSSVDGIVWKVLFEYVRTYVEFLKLAFEFGCIQFFRFSTRCMGTTRISYGSSLQ